MPKSDDIARLPVMEQDILLLHMQLRKSQTEVAKILGVSPRKVQYRIAEYRDAGILD